MKKSLLFAAMLLILIVSGNAQVGINNDGSQPNSAAMLDVKSTSSGLLPPRMTKEQRDAIPNPPEGLIVICTDCGMTNPAALSIFINGAWRLLAGYCTTPNNPVAGTHTATTTQITWNWNSVAGASGYKWSSTNSSGTATDVGNVTSKVETGLTCNTSYTRYVWAYNECGLSSPATLQKNTNPSAPSSPTAGIHVPGITQVVWNWNAVSGATGYKWSTTNNFTTATDMGTSLTKTETGLTCNTGYSRYVWATGTCGNSNSRLLTATTLTNPPLAPDAGTHVPSLTQIVWNWTPVTEAGGYKWNTVNNYSTATDMGTATSKAETGLTCNTSYTRYVWAYSVCGSSAATAMTQSTTQNPTVSMTISASANPCCNGTTVVFTASPVSGGPTPGYQWAVNGVNAGTNSDTYSFIPVNGDAIVCTLTSSDPCATGSPAISNSITMTVTPPPTAPAAGTQVPSLTQIVWNWNTVAGATGYKWNTSNDYETATDMGTATTKTETDLTCSIAYTRYVWAYNTCGSSSAVSLAQSTSACIITCGDPVTVNHVAGAVAPVSKTVIYGTVTNIPGEPTKCWITSNLGADHQATAMNDATEASAGWCWQFNLKQGYKHDGTIRTPNTTWISTISDNSDWIITNDPCNIELGNTWRIPSFSEWYNVDNYGSWTTWDGPWNSGLKLHAAGYINSDGSLINRGLFGYHWSSSQNDATSGWDLGFGNPYCQLSNYNKTYGFSLRCISGVCSMPNPPPSGNHVPAQNQIIWNWNLQPGATGYKFNTTNDYATATDMGTSTTKTETGLNCSVAYTRFVWAYNSCGNSSSTMLTQATLACPTFTCGQNIAINHVAGAVAPVGKTTAYGTVTNIPGETSKCWITSNLGSDHQATAVNDATEASAGWYWQFNRKQGYKHDGTIVTPAWTITSISENSDWISANDPCSLEAGGTWRLPTYTEWYNVDNIGGWVDWNGPWNSALKLHAAGYINNDSNGSLNFRGSLGYYRSKTQFNLTFGWALTFGNAYSNMGDYSKAYGFTIRCIK